jgi:hypothetical protein
VFYVRVGLPVCGSAPSASPSHPNVGVGARADGGIVEGSLPVATIGPASGACGSSIDVDSHLRLRRWRSSACRRARGGGPCARTPMLCVRQRCVHRDDHQVQVAHVCAHHARGVGRDVQGRIRHGRALARPAGA